MTIHSNPGTNTPETSTENLTDAVTAAPVEATEQSGWVLFDPATSEFVDLPIDHPVHTQLQLAGSVPRPIAADDLHVHARDLGRGLVVVDRDGIDDDGVVDDDVLDELDYWLSDQEPGGQVDPVAASAYWTWVPTAAQQARIEGAIAHAGPERAGASPLQALTYANWINLPDTAAPTATELDGQWWNDRAHNTTTDHTTDHHTSGHGTDASSGVIAGDGATDHTSSDANDDVTSWGDR